MRNTNTTLDREPLSSETIRERQNFNYVLKETAAARVPLWKSAWFYGPVGIAMVTMVVSAVRMNPKNEQYDAKTTLSQSTETPKIEKAFAPPVLNVHAVALDKKNTSKAEKTNVEASNPSVINGKSVQKSEGNTVLKPEVLTEEKTSFTPKTTVPEPVKIVQKNTMPDIAGVFNGRISVTEICAAGMIHCNNDYEVISYEIQYDNGTGTTVDRIAGNTIPQYICSNLKRFNVGSPVFITRIIAQNTQGVRKMLFSMSLEPTF